MQRRAAAIPCRRSRCRTAGRPTTRRGRRGRRRAVLRARASARPRASSSATQRRRGRGDLPAGRRAPAGDRAGGGPLRAALAQRDRRAPGRARSARWRQAHATRPPASGRCARRSTGATTCSSDDEKACFARFAVFAGGATVRGGRDDHRRQPRHARPARRQEPARAPPAADGPTRLGMLETIRAYAARTLRRDADCDAVRERHFRYFRSLAGRHGPDPALDGPDRGEHLAALDRRPRTSAPPSITQSSETPRVKPSRWPRCSSTTG